MARFRSIQTNFWQDNFVVKLPLEEKLFYNYLLTNSRTTQCGIYNFSLIFTAVELGCSEERVKQLLEAFINYGKILYDEATEEIMIINWYKFNLNSSRNTLICINRELKDVKNQNFIEKFYELCKSKKYPLEIIFNDIDFGQAIEIKSEAENDNENNTKSIKDVIKTFSSNIHLPTPIEMEDLKDWCSKLDEEIVIMAINEAARNNARSMKYINGILINWKDGGISSVEEAKSYTKQWQNKLDKNTRAEDTLFNTGAYKVVGEV